MDEITVAQAAAVLDVSAQTVRWAIRRRHIQARRVGQRVLLVQRASVDAYQRRREARRERLEARHDTGPDQAGPARSGRVPAGGGHP